MEIRPIILYVNVPYWIDYWWSKGEVGTPSTCANNGIRMNMISSYSCRVVCLYRVAAFKHPQILYRTHPINGFAHQIFSRPQKIAPRYNTILWFDVLKHRGHCWCLCSLIVSGKSIGFLYNFIGPPCSADNCRGINYTVFHEIGIL